MPKLREEEEFARKNHLGIWMYGDIPDDELDEPEVFLFSFAPPFFFVFNFFFFSFFLPTTARVQEVNSKKNSSFSIPYPLVFF